jgi:hypothetical protein
MRRAAVHVAISLRVRRGNTEFRDRLDAILKKRKADTRNICFPRAINFGYPKLHTTTASC